MKAELLQWIWVALLSTGIILVFIRLLIGKGRLNRIMALDTLTTISTSLLMVISIYSGERLFLDVAIVYAILAFTSVIAVAKYCDAGRRS